MHKSFSKLNNKRKGDLNTFLTSIFPESDSTKANTNALGEFSGISGKSVGRFIDDPNVFLKEQGIEEQPYKSSLMSFDLVKLMKVAASSPDDGLNILNDIDTIMKETEGLKHGIHVLLPRTKSAFNGNDTTTVFGEVNSNEVTVDLGGLKHPSFLLRVIL